MKTKILTYTVFIGLIIAACNSEPKFYTIKQVYPGFTNLHAEHQDSITPQDSAHQRMPPVMDADILDKNIIEAPDGKVYAYFFPKKSIMLCGFMNEGGKYKTEIYRPDLDSLKPSQLTLIDSNNCVTIAKRLITGEAHNHVSIGIQHDSSKNPILLDLVNKMYSNSYTTSWRVRKTLPKENEVLNHLHSK